MADHSLPQLTSPYADYTAYLKARLDDLLLASDPARTTSANFPNYTMRFSSALSKWQTFDGSDWVDSASTYAISISGNSATATTLATARNINGVSFNGSANISVNTVNSVTFNNAGTGDISGTTFNGASAKTISYNTVGAPSVTGTNASGTWSIGVTGNAGTATVLATARNINGVSFNGSTDIGINLNNSVTFSNTGGAAVNTTFNGSLARTVSYNTVGAPSTTGTNASGTWNINISGTAASVSFIPSGTVMLFGQSTAPTGWTKLTTHNNKALRVVSGAAGSGGTVDFTTAFQNQGISISGTSDSTTLSESQIPSHRHFTGNNSESATWARYGLNGDAWVGVRNMNANGNGYDTNTSNTGGSGSHNHTFSTSSSINLAVQYVDVIMAAKD